VSDEITPAYRVVKDLGRHVEVYVDVAPGDFLPMHLLKELVHTSDGDRVVRGVVKAWRATRDAVRDGGAF
jgi:hypothetical protein